MQSHIITRLFVNQHNILKKQCLTANITLDPQNSKRKRQHVLYVC